MYVVRTFFHGNNSCSGGQKGQLIKIHIIFNYNVYLFDNYISLHNCLI